MRIFLLFACFMLSALPLTARGDDAAALLAKHKAFVGWQFGDGSLASVATDGAGMDRQKDGTYKPGFTFHKTRAGVAYRTDYKILGKRPHENSTGFTGRVYWASDENGFTRPELGDVQRYNLAFDLLFNEATTSLPGTVKGTATVDGMPTTIVGVTDPNSYPIDLYVDPNTGEYKRAVIDPDGLYQTTINILSYTDASAGKKIISKWSYGSKESGYDEITKITPGIAVTPEDLHPPKAIAYWTFGKTPARVKLSDERIYVTAKVNGVEGTFIFDSGDGGGILLSQDFAGRANVKVVGSVKGVGVGGVASQSAVRIDSLQIGGSTLHNVVAQAQDMGYKPFHEENGLSADGLIGYDILAGAVVSLNLDAGTMLVQDPSITSVDSSKGLLAVVDLTDAIPRLPAKIDGIDVNASLDTGNAGYVLYGPDLRSKYGLTMMTHLARVGGIGGWSFAQCGSLGDVTIGPIVYKAVAGCEDQDWSGREILLGLDFLRHFNYIFDYPHAQIVIIPRNDQ
jgi:predicted aspartyl protease